MAIIFDLNILRFFPIASSTLGFSIHLAYIFKPEDAAKNYWIKLLLLIPLLYSCSDP